MRIVLALLMLCLAAQTGRAACPSFDPNCKPTCVPGTPNCPVLRP